MSNILEEAIKALEEKLEGKSIDFSAKFQIEDIILIIWVTNKRGMN